MAPDKRKEAITYLYIQELKAVPQDTLSGEHIRAYRKSNRLTLRDMAALLNLSTTSSLLQYEKGSKPISGIASRRLADLTNISTIRGTLFTTQKADGMQLGLEISGHIMHCTCGVWFLAKKRTNRYHTRACQLRDWRQRRKYEQ